MSYFHFSNYEYLMSAFQYKVNRFSTFNFLCFQKLVNFYNESVNFESLFTSGGGGVANTHVKYQPGALRFKNTPFSPTKNTQNTVLKHIFQIIIVYFVHHLYALYKN